MAAGVIPGSLDALAKFGGVAAVGNRSATSVDIPGKKKSMFFGILMWANFCFALPYSLHVVNTLRI